MNPCMLWQDFSPTKRTTWHVLSLKARTTRESTLAKQWRRSWVRKGGKKGRKPHYQDTGRVPTTLKRQASDAYKPLMKRFKWSRIHSRRLLRRMTQYLIYIQIADVWRLTRVSETISKEVIVEYRSNLLIWKSGVDLADESGGVTLPPIVPKKVWATGPFSDRLWQTWCIKGHRQSEIPQVVTWSTWERSSSTGLFIR